MSFDKNGETLSTILPSDSSSQLLSSFLRVDAAFSMWFCKIPRELCRDIWTFMSIGYILKLSEGATRSKKAYYMRTF